MANTSLAQQLKQLALPQTSLLLKTHKRDSFLFDPNEAANLDLETVLEIGLSGLRELQELNPEFHAFENSLFDVTSVGVQRAVLERDTNDLLDEKINRFLSLLSPYVLLKPAHRALEWLIQRFQVHLYNRDAFIFLWLPYHESKIFVRAIQLVEFSRKTDPWYWLDAVNQTGAPLSRNAVINQAAANNSFIAGVCNHVLHSVKIHKSEAKVLASLFAFYCTTIVGAIEGVKKRRKGSLQSAKESQLQVILPCLLKGLSSSQPDFESASFIIISALSRNGYIGLTLLHKIINKIVKSCSNESSSLKEVATLLAVICETQSSSILSIIPSSALKKLLRKHVAIPLIEELAAVSQEVYVDKLAMALLAGILPLTKSSSETTDDDLALTARETLNGLLQAISFERDSAKEAIRFLVSALADLIEEKELKETIDDDYLKWLERTLQNMENRYPTAFDAVIQKMTLGKAGDKQKVAPAVLGRLLGISTLNQDVCKDLMERLCHPEEGVRVAAISMLAEMDIESLKKKDDHHSLVWVIEQRLQDDSPDVIEAALKLPFLNSLVVKKSLIERIISILSEAIRKMSGSSNLKKWNDVILLALKTLLSKEMGQEGEGESEEENHEVLMQRIKIIFNVLPFICPSTKEDVSMVKKVSEINCCDPLLNALFKEFSEADNSHNFCSSVYEYLLKLPVLAEEEGICSSDMAKTIMQCGIEMTRNQVMQFLMLISLSGLASSAPTEMKYKILKHSVQVFENAKIMAAMEESDKSISYKISEVNMASCLKCAKKGYMPLQALLHTFSAIFSSSNSSWFPLATSKDFKWWSIFSFEAESSTDLSIQLVVHIFDILISGCFSNDGTQKSRKLAFAQQLYIQCLKDLFEIHLPELHHKLNFLSSLWVAHEIPLNVPPKDGIPVIKEESKKSHSCQPIVSMFTQAYLPELQIRCLNLGEALISKSESPVSWLLEPSGMGAAIVPSLLVACASPVKCVRMAAVRVLKVMINTVGTHLASCKAGYAPLVKEMVAQREEIVADAGHLVLLMYTQLSTEPEVLSLLSSEKKKQMAEIRKALCNIVDPESGAPCHLVRALLQIMYGVRSLELMRKFAPLGLSLLEEGQRKISLDEYEADSLVFVINRLDESVAPFIDGEKDENSAMWNFLLKAASDTQTRLPLTSDVKQFLSLSDNIHTEETCPSILIASQITRDFYDALPSEEHRKKVLSVLVDVASQKNAGSSEVVLPLSESASLAAKRVMKKLTLDADMIVVELSKMLPAVEEVSQKKVSILRSKKVTPAISLKTLQSPQWSRGVTLLEIIQNKKKLRNSQKILPVLFELLRACLQLKHQEPVEYTKQLILACALHSLRKVAMIDRELESDDEMEDKKIDEQQFDVETIVQCIRSTQNPHTHRHALLLLSSAAEVVPDSVLHNVMAIFAFVGTSMVRQDDEYSFEVISRTIESIVPVLVKVGPKSLETTSSKVITNLPEGLEFLEGPRVEGALKVMRVFADAIPDVPPHRRLPLYLKLVETVGWETGLSQLLLLIIEDQVLHRGSKNKEVEKLSSSKNELAYEMARRASPNAFIRCCLRMIKYIKLLPADKESGPNGKLLWHPGQNAVPFCSSVDYLHIFDVKNYTGVQLRHFKHAVLSFLSDILSEPHLAEKLSLAERPENLDKLNELPDGKVFQYLIQEVLGYIANIAIEIEDSDSENPLYRYWKVIQQRCHLILEKVNALLPVPLFLSVVKGLLGHHIPSIRRKAADILNARLVTLLNDNDTTATLSEDNKISLREILLGPLMNMVKVMEGSPHKVGQNLTKDTNLNCQIGLLTAKLIIRILGPTEKPSTLKPMLVLATKVASTSLRLEEESIHTFGGILASATLCIAEVCFMLKIKVLEELHNFVPVLLSALTAQLKASSTVSTVKLGIVTAVQRVVESLPNFLSPYIRPLIIRMCLLASQYTTVEAAEQPKEIKGDPTSLRLSALLNKVAKAIPLRVLIPSVNDSFKMLSKEGNETPLPTESQKSKKRKSRGDEEQSSSSDDGLENVVNESERLMAIIPLMQMFSYSLSEMSHEDLTHHLQELEHFFLYALDFRIKRESGEIKVLENVENSVIQAIVTLVLKLSEASFRPFYYRLFEWVSQEGAPPKRSITFYRLSNKFAEALKGLFVLFAGNFIRHAANLLDLNNIAQINESKDQEKENDESISQPVQKDLFFGDEDADGSLSHTLIKYILSTLHAVFQYDGTGHFVTRARFETLMLPLVNQLENMVGGKELFQERCSSVLVPTIVQLAVSSADDSLWKQLNYQILLKTRHSNPQVRLAGLATLLELGKQLGEDFLPLLPETVPFLAELMEDEEESVESATQSALNILSDVLGEPLQKYF